MICCVVNYDSKTFMLKKSVQDQSHERYRWSSILLEFV